MASTTVRSSLLGGKGLFATQKITAGSTVLNLPRPLVGVLDRSRTLDTCSWCFAWTELPILPGTGVNQSPTTVNWCTGCRKVKYCSKRCQAAAWKAHHKRECGILNAHRDEEIPQPVMAVLQVLLGLRDSKEERYRAVMELVSHRDDFERAGGPRWKAMLLMAHTALKLLGSSPDDKDAPVQLQTVRSAVCVLLCNSSRLVTPTFDPLGLCLDPVAACINHSCAPNAIVVFDGPKWTLRSLEDIGSGEEILISYIDTAAPKGVRQAELQSQYFFQCKCKACTSPTETSETAFRSVGPDFDTRIATIDALIPQLSPDPAWARHDQGFSAHAQRLTALQFYAYSLLASPDDDTPTESQTQNPARLRRALAVIRNTGIYPDARGPLPALYGQHAANCLAEKRYNEALIALLRRWFGADTKLYGSQPAHPVRVVHAWTLATLARAVGADPEAPFCAALAQCGVDLSLLFLGLLKEVRENVGRSHGETSLFARLVDVVWRELMAPGGEVEAQFGQQGVPPAKWRGALEQQVRELMPRVEAFLKDESLAAQMEEAMAN